MELKLADKTLSNAPISNIKTNLDRIFGKEKWYDFEPETISLEIGVQLSPLLLDKIRVIQIISKEPDRFFNDVLFFVFSTDVINNNVADFDYMTMPLTLEMAYAITEVQKITGSQEFGEGVKEVIKYTLKQEGYSEALAPFDQAIEDSDLTPGQTEEDTADKQAAIIEYIKEMSSGNTH